MNGRPVSDPVLRTAVRVAYRDVIPAGRHPVVALYLELPPEELDVNVHPAKAEVRFRDPDAVRSLVIGTLNRALAGGAALDRVGHAGAPPGAAPLYPVARAPAVSPVSPTPSCRSPPPRPRASWKPPRWPRPRIIPLGAPVAQILDTYILAVAGDGGFVMVDQHAAHERLTHEALREQALAGAVRVQPLLLPAVVELPPADVHRLLSRAAELARLGLELEGFGPGAVLVRALPAVLGATDPARCCATSPTNSPRWRRRLRWPPGSMRCWRAWPATAASAPGGG